MASGEMAPWYSKVHGRAKTRIHPPIIEEALRTIAEIQDELTVTGRLHLSQKYPHGTFLDREPHQRTPPYWKLRHADGFDVEETRQLYHAAHDAWDRLSPIERANENLQWALGMVALEDQDITDPRVIEALMDYRQVLTTFYSTRNPAVAAHLLEIEQALDRIRDTMRCLILKRIFKRELPDDQARQIIELLEGEAAAGFWPDAEEDVERAWAEATVA